MPYGRPVSRRRRRRFHGTDSASVIAVAKREAKETAPHASTGSETSASPHDAPRHYHRQGSVPSAMAVPVAVPSPDLLRAGHKAGVWPLRERLLLASALLDTDNQQLTWPPISRRLAKFTPPPSCGFTRPPTWCSARACAKQYSLLLDSAEMFRKQQVDVERSAEEGRVVFQAPSDVAAAPATVGLSLAEFIVKRLTVERVEELRSQIISTRQKYRLFKEMLAKVESGKLDKYMDTLWAIIQRQQEEHSTSGSAELPTDTPPEVAEFVRELNSWTDPFDVPPSVWMVPGGSGAALRSVPSIAKVTTPKKMPPIAVKPKSPPERRPSDSSRNSTAEAAEGEGGDASGERTSTPSTSVMSESDLEYGEGTLKAESPDSDRLEEKEEEEDSTIPLLSSSGDSPKAKPKVACSPDVQSSPMREVTAVLSPQRLNEEMLEDWKGPKTESDIQEKEKKKEAEEEEKEATFQPRRLRLRLSRQGDGNLSVVPESTSSAAVVAPVPPTPPLRLRLSLAPTKALKDQWSVEILEEAFPDIKPEQFQAPRKRLRSSNRINDSEVYEAAKSILTAAEKQACAVASGETSTQRKKIFVHSVLSQLARAVYTTPASPLRKDGAVISVDVARAVYARITSILQRYVAESPLKSEQSTKSGSRKPSRKK
ncbi:Bromodomain-containing protein 8 [Taenia solium]